MLIKPFRPGKLAYFMEFEKTGTPHALLFPCDITGFAIIDEMTTSTKLLYQYVLDFGKNIYKMNRIIKLPIPPILPLFLCSCGSINQLPSYSNNYRCTCGAQYTLESVLALPKAEKD
jgi:hypothetical protein